MSRPLDIYVIGDTQVKPRVRNPLICIAHDIVASRPDVVVHLGDHWDLPSLSSYDKGRKSFHSRKYINDIDAGNLAMEEFWKILKPKFTKKWKPKFIILKGNHEERINRAIEYGPSEFEGLLELVSPDYTNWDEVVPFLKPHSINGIHFVHYVANEFSGKPLASAHAALMKKHCSVVQGHKQTLDQAEHITLDGRRIMSLIIGASYFHNEEYKGPQGNHHFRGIAILHNAHRGCWEIEIKNLVTLGRRYG